VWAWYEKTFGREWIDAAQSEIAACEASLDTAFQAAAQ